MAGESRLIPLVSRTGARFWHNERVELGVTQRFVYGTAWKEDRTAQLTEAAVRAGFRAIDTANQRRHYSEAAVGDGLKAAYAAGVTRGELFLQTKFTYR